MRSWLASSLSHKVLAVVALVMGAASVGFLALFLNLYRAQLEEERSHASERINRLLQASLENAMLKRDLEGLVEIVTRLGEQEGIAGVMILNPDGEVRFASSEDRLGARLDFAAVTRPETRFLVNEQGQEVLRSINPVANKPPCEVCHGPIAENPINGILFVDYDAATLRTKALGTAITLGGSGAIVLLATLALLFWAMRSLVVRPVESLAATSTRLAEGDFHARAPIHGRDELGRLGMAFNRMASTVRSRDAFQQGLIDGVPDGIRVIDSDYRIIAANRAYCQQVGQRLDQVVGAACYRSSHGNATPCPRTLITCPLHELLEQGRPGPLKAIHQHMDAEGEPFFVEVTAAPFTVIDEAGEKRCLLVESIRDMREDISISHGQRLSEVAQLATGVAHEVRNPMVAIGLTLDGLLRSGLSGTGGQVRSPEDLERSLTLIREQVTQCITVSERLLTLTQFSESGVKPVSLRAVLDDASALLHYEAVVCGVDMAVDLPPADCQVMGNGAELRMVIVNLMQNAFHAMPGGGTLALGVRETGGQAHIHIADSGVGIAPDILQRIFDPYFSRRADGAEGTGMGLTICKDIVEAHGGTITANSTPGEGTTFTVSLPLWADD